MSDAMVTGRMPAEKKQQVGRILKRNGMSASQAINLLYDRIIEEGGVGFFAGSRSAPDASAWKSAAEFVDSLVVKQTTRFDSMSHAEIKADRLRSQGLM